MLDNIKLITCDLEVFPFDWLFVGKSYDTGAYTIIHNDSSALKEFVNQNDDAIYGGFNIKHYDQHIIKAICCGADNQMVKEISDFIINGGRGWEHPFLRSEYFWLSITDVKDDMQKGLSLKAIEGHLGLPIQETSVKFDIDRPLTQEELTQTILYCRHDVDSTEKVIDERSGYLSSKLLLGRMANISDTKSLSMTNAKLAAAFLGATKTDRDDGRDYEYPPELDKSVIPVEILNFFDQIYDSSIADDDLFKTRLDIDLGGCMCRFAWGGVHGSLLCYHERATSSRVIQNIDVKSLYPALLIEHGYMSRNCHDPDVYRQTRDARIQAKKEKNKALAQALKNPLNATSGAMENQYNDLYDPRNARSMRISGQLFLTQLLMNLLNGCKTFKPLNFNTDGLMYSVDVSELSQVKEICSTWEKIMKFELEMDEIQEVWIKDVNNLLFINQDGSVKAVGGYLVSGITEKGAWNINNNAPIMKTALIKFFSENIPIEQTINECDDIFQFQLIAKAGIKYREAYQMIDNTPHPVQKVNRVYATNDPRYGKLYKVKAENDLTAQIEMLPEHCVIDNENQLSIMDIDKTFYIDMAHKRANDFLGIKPEKIKKERTKKMATAKTETKPSNLNIYQKLLEARVRFLEADIKKSGKNMKLTYKYYELEDIVPTATKIFQQLGLITLISFTDDYATMLVVDLDNPDHVLRFTSPMREIEPIISSKTGGEVVNAMQRLGSVETYQRRYLYLTALDICEHDDFDRDAGGDGNIPISNPPKQPPTPTQREETVHTLTTPEDNASDLQIRALKDALKQLRESDPTQEDFVAEIAVKTNGFQTISKTACEKLISTISDMITAKKEG